MWFIWPIKPNPDSCGAGSPAGCYFRASRRRAEIPHMIVFLLWSWHYALLANDSEARKWTTCLEGSNGKNLGNLVLTKQVPTHGLHYVWPFFSVFEYGYIDREQFACCAGYEISPPITDPNSVPKELWTTSVHHIAYLEKIRWHFVSQSCSHVTQGMHEIITEVTVSSYTLYHSSVYMPVNNSEIKY